MKREDGTKEKALLYYDGERVGGKVCLSCNPSTRPHHHPPSRQLPPPPPPSTHTRPSELPAAVVRRRWCPCAPYIALCRKPRAALTPSTLFASRTHLALDRRALQIEVKLKNPSKKLDHYGIKVEFIGQIQLFYDRANHHEFTSLVRPALTWRSCLF